ncbi:MAG TPA: GlsB/YeaQ/YmgE family stress response membrane protein [Hyphomicrobiaceae bacterium]|nr:GlsB/YeaQ/YmgE family stress response membrane protein [Hyphomicrobiaceae bacterium]
MSLLQNPWVIMIINGLIAGWLAGLLLGGGGLIRNLVVGILGAFIGGALVQMSVLKLPVDFGSWGNQIIVSTIGALLLIIIARIIAR